jgi:hypothetical protein
MCRGRTCDGFLDCGYRYYLYRPERKLLWHADNQWLCTLTITCTSNSMLTCNLCQTNAATCAWLIGPNKKVQLV